MKYIATVNNEPFEIEIMQEGEIILGDERLSFDFQSVAGQPVYSLLLNGKSYEAYVFPSDTGMEVLLQGQLFLVEIEDERQRRLRQASGSQITQTGEFKLKAPMPGLLVAVQVEEGQQVDQGQTLIVLESMKMQNELKAPRAGVVSRIPGKPGDSVNQGQILIILS